MKPSFFYPVKPHKINREWGYFSPTEYQQFGFMRHNGVDLALVNGQPIFAPLEADVLRVGNVPNGSGIFVSMISSQSYTFNDGKESYAYVEFFHCLEIKVKEGDHVVPGQLLAFGDNTGFSTGSHTHMQPRRVEIVSAPPGATYVYKLKGVDICINVTDINDANGTFDPVPYFNGTYAVDTRPFFRDLSVNSSGDDVMALQKILNSDADTRIATQGPGSPGKETTKFGELTKNAVKKFQLKYRLSMLGASNYGMVDLSTRNKLQELFQKSRG